MEVVGALASSLQIVSQCGQVTMTVIRWIESVRTVDERIDAFIHEVSTLRMTYEGLSRSLKDPSVLEAARITNRDVGGHLWTQLSRTLHDCEVTMNSITIVLGKIQSSSNFLRPVLKQLKESLHTGELCRLREQVVLFNSSLQLPMQMITLTLQLRQQEMTTANQLHLNEQLVLLRKGIERIERISSGLSKPRRMETASSATMVDDMSDRAWVENMEKYVGTAKRFLDSASVAASTLSTPSTNQHDDESPVGNDVRRGSTFIPITFEKMKTITSFVDDLVPPDSGMGSGTPLPSDALSETELSHNPAYDSDDDDDVDLQLLQALLQNGHSEVTSQNYSAAEENFKEALLLSQSNNFGSQVACSTTDITLMLGECLAKQEKYDETIELLQPVASLHAVHSDAPQSGALSTISSSRLETDKGQMLAANHLLGKVYLKKADYANAEKSSVQAFKGRKKLLGETHVKTIESVQLVIDMYKAKGQNARAEAHRIFLKPAQDSQSEVTEHTPPNKQVSPVAELVVVPNQPSPTRQRRPTFFDHFRRTDKSESPPVPVPTTRNSQAQLSPFLVADEFNRLSTSPNETSSLHMGSESALALVDRAPADRNLRKQSTNSAGGYANLQRWTTSSDIDSLPPTHQRTTSSISRPPTLYSSLSPTDLEQRFLEVSTLYTEGKASKAIDRSNTLLQLYDPEATILTHRKAELKENIKKGKNKGLGGTGHGFAPIHFFCSMRYEATTEIDILLRLGADPNAVAYKAGYGKVDPFNPLSLAIERGHENVVRILLDGGAAWDPDAMRIGARVNPDRDGMHPLLQAVQKGAVNIVRTLLEHKIEMTEEFFPRLSWHGNSLLHEACFRCDLEMVELLLNFARHNGTLYDTSYNFIGNPSQQDEFGMTAVMYAVDMRDYNEKLRAYKLRNRIACLRLLLDLNTNVADRHRTSSEGRIESPSDHTRQTSPNKFDTSLHLQDKRGNTVYWYVDESRAEDSELVAFLNEQSRKSRLIEL